MMRLAEPHEKNARLRAIEFRLLTLLLCMVVVTANAYGQIVLPHDGQINTVAGDGSCCFSGDGETATNAGLSFPYGVALDSSGNIYIADSVNERIRKVTASTGIISTVAGNGTAGYSGDGGLATSAKLFSPGDVAVDSVGNIYIADTENHRIRKVTASTGVISTIAGNGTSGYSGDGGPATNAELYYPGGVALDSAANVYITDLTNRVRKVTVSTGIISTVAGNGTEGYSGDGGPATSACLSIPDAVAVDTSGNIYIADFGNNVIRKVMLSTGIISTVAGNGTRGYSGDGGAATSAEMSSPEGVGLDSSGNIYITDQTNRVRKVTVSTGIISTVAGDGTGGYSGDGGPATSAEIAAVGSPVLDGAGDIYIPDSDNNRIREVAASTGIIFTVAGGGIGDGAAATSAQISADGVAVDSSGNIYIADSNNGRIRKVMASTGIISTVAGNGAVGYAGDGGAATGAELYDPAGVAVDPSGKVYIVDLGNNVIRKVTISTGIISTVAGNGTQGYSGDGGAATSAELNAPNAVAVDSTGNIYIADTNNYRIRKVTASTGVISTVAGNGTKGYLGDGGAATNAELSFPNGIAVDTAGNFYIADFGNNVVRKVTASTGIISTVAGNGTEGYSGDGGPATTAELNGPYGVALDIAGNIYIADYNDNRVRKVTTYTGFISTVAGNGIENYSGDGGSAILAELSTPTSVAVDSVGNIYVADDGNLRIRAVGPMITWATPAAITYGTALSGTQLDAKTTVAGSLAYSPPSGTVLTAGAHTLSVGFTPSNPAAYNAATDTVTLTVNQAIPKITWANPAAISYGTALSTTQLDATATVGSVTLQGNFAYTPPLGTVLAAGPQTLSVTFTPNDSIDYATVTDSVSLSVTKVPLTVTANSTSRAYGITNPQFSDTITGFVNGDTLSVVSGSASLTTTATISSAPGSYPITAARGTLSAANYSFSTYVAGTLTITQAIPVIIWATPAPIAYGTALSSTQLDATTSVQGSFAYTPAAGTVLAAGTQTLSVVFTPSNQTDYATVPGSASLIVLAIPTITLAASSGSSDSSLTITGTNFGSAQNSSTVTFSGTPATVTNWSTTGTSITVTVPPTLVAGSYSVVVSIDAIAQSAPATFTITPNVTGLSFDNFDNPIPPGNISSTLSGPPQVGFLIIGSGFGPNDSPEDTFVSLNGQELTVVAWSNTQLQVQVPASLAIGGPYPLIVTYSGIVSNSNNTFNVTQPLGCAHP